MLEDLKRICCIAGGAIAGIIIAFMAGALGDTTRTIEAWAHAHNPFFLGGSADLLSMLPFVALMVMLVLVGREVILKPSTSGPRR